VAFTMHHETHPLDCLVIGAGPAGLTAAIYLARFHLSLAVIDSGDSRLALVPRTRNHAGYPGGIEGKALLAKMRDQAAEFGVAVRPGTVDRLERTENGYRAMIGSQTMEARSVLLATGVVNRRPKMDEAAHDAGVANGLIRYCPICDGYEVTDRRIGVIGTQSHGFREAVFLRMYSDDVTLIAPDQKHQLSADEQAHLAELGIDALDGPCEPLRVDGDEIIVSTPLGDCRFDSVYPALGSIIRSKLAVDLGADATEDGCLVIDAHQRTSLPGLYAAGDVAKGLDQISHAMGEAGVAATTIRNDLAARTALIRSRRSEQAKRAERAS
jgi:thioredoxin reductase (NADPH)